MKKIVTFMSLCIVFAMQSCSSDQEPQIPETQKPDASISHMVVKFEDKIYETDVMEIGDSVKYVNEDFAEVYRSKIANNPDIAVLVSNDESDTSYVEFYLSEKELLQNHKFLHLKGDPLDMTDKMTRSDTIYVPKPSHGAILGFAELYDDKKYKDTMLVTGVATSWSHTVAKLKDFGFNDKTSSIKVYNKMNPNTQYTITYMENPNNTLYQHNFGGNGLRPVLKSYHNSNYSGAVLYCIAPQTGSSEIHSDYNLKNIGWNDRISSLEWMLVFDFSKFNGENPEIPAHPDC